MNLYEIHPDPENAPYRDWAFENVPALVWERYRDDPKELKKREKVLAREAKYAYRYAFHVLGGPFPAGEGAIAKDAFYAYWYAAEILKRPFPAGEAAIAKYSYWACRYVTDVLKGPFPAGEAAIAQDPNDAFKYSWFLGLPMSGIRGQVL